MVPARKRHKEARRAERRAQIRVDRYEENIESVDAEWREHQLWEMQRRCPLLVQPPKPPPFDIRPALTRVLADFATWASEIPSCA